MFPCPPRPPFDGGHWGTWGTLNILYVCVVGTGAWDMGDMGDIGIVYIYVYVAQVIPQRRSSLKNLSEGPHLFECSLSFILLRWKIYTPTAHTFLSFIVWVVVDGGGRIYL